MKVTLSLDPEVERRLTARAHERGMSLDTFLQEVVVNEAGTTIQAATPTGRHIADVIRERMSKVPPEIMTTMPKDGASQHDHYIYGFAKREE